MSTLPTVLGTFIERRRRRTTTDLVTLAADPVALAAARRAATAPPSEAQIAALVGVVATDALGRPRTGPARGTLPDDPVADLDALRSHRADPPP